jgi:5-methylcytosine-specific restriction endonuclease McrA
VSARGTTNRNDRGSAESRRRRKTWLLSPEAGFGGDGVAVQCFNCPAMLTWTTLTVDRILAGVLGGRYIRSNIRPACMHCNSTLGTKLREDLRHGRLVAA